MTWPRNARFAVASSRRNLLAFRKRVMKLNALSRSARLRDLDLTEKKPGNLKETDPTG
jgi:hypothetical protein